MFCDPKSSHCLVELSSSMLSRMSDNVITLSDVSCHNVIQYNRIQYGSNIRCVGKKKKWTVEQLY